MKSNQRFLPLFRSGLAAIVILASALPAAAQTYFRVNSAGGNTLGAVLTIDHPALNGKPKVKPLITQFWSGVYNPHPVGVQYNTAAARWQIVNEDGANIPANAKFNVLVAKGTKTVLVSAANSTGNLSFFPTAKGKPDANLLATHVTNPVPALPGTFSQRYHGLYFLPAGASYGNQWSIYSESEDNMEALGFHVADLSKAKNGSNPASFSFTATGGNVLFNEATIANPLTTGNPNDFVFIQHVWSFASPTYLDKPLGVYYNGTTWSVFTQDASDMPNNVRFVVVVLPGTGI